MAPAIAGFTSANLSNLAIKFCSAPSSNPAGVLLMPEVWVSEASVASLFEVFLEAAAMSKRM
ncbi:MAG: hypothetical protein PHP35_03035, partial [Candidatus Colwellbacteria bacterium]|nr:hypothetical protein [Candidatus Colwellbacteria bacterium]